MANKYHKKISTWTEIFRYPSGHKINIVIKYQLKNSKHKTKNAKIAVVYSNKLETFFIKL